MLISVAQKGPDYKTSYSELPAKDIVQHCSVRKPATYLQLFILNSATATYARQ